MYRNTVFPFYPWRSISHTLILGMVIISLIGFFIPEFRLIFGFGWIDGNIPHTLASVVLFQFLHGDIFHLLMNGIFLYQAWPEVETRMSKSRFWYFFLFSTIFVALSLHFLSDAITIGMSGFCMALLSYLWIDLFTTKHPLANQILIMLIINIALWLSGNISFVGHASGAVFGLIWWKVFRDWKK